MFNTYIKGIICFFYLLFSIIRVDAGTFNSVFVIDTASQKVLFSISTYNSPISKLDKKYSSLNKQFNKKNCKYLRKLKLLERKVCLSFLPKDSVIVKQLLESRNNIYATNQPNTGSVYRRMSNATAYIPSLDSISTATSYLLNGIKNALKINSSQLTHLKQVSNLLQENFDATKATTQALSQRIQLMSQLSPQSLNASSFKLFQQQVYYYQQQIEYYKEILNDKNLLEQKILSELRNLPAFQSFWQRNSLLAQLFPATGNIGTTQALAGLQSRALVQQLLTQQVGGTVVTTGSNPQQFIQQQMQSAQNQLNTLKDKINQLGGGNNALIMPDFTPNKQKTKTIWQRFEYGINIQSQKTNYYLPVTSDIAGTIGYKLNDKSTVGVGVAYKMGWGNGINDVRISNQGIGLRSFLDIKIKGSIWVTGGYEQNYQSAFTQIPQLQNYSAWQTSGLIGITKKMKVGKKASNVQLLWDFLSYRNIPVTQPLKFRIGYNF